MMTLDFQRLMADATRLTRAGDLRAATAAIQDALGHGLPPAAYPAPASRESGDVIDVPSRELPGQAGHPAPGQDRFIAGSHGDGTSRRAFKLYIPPQAGDRPLPLIVMLHGCTQDPDDFAAGTAMNELARAHGFFVLYPAQSAKANPQRCWNWFKHSHQSRGRGEPETIAAMTREVMQRHAIDPARVYAAGLSAGGAMAAILGEAYPDLFAAVGVHSGLAAGSARDLPSALAAMKSGGQVRPGQGVPAIVFHGDADSTVHPVNGEQVLASSTAGATADTGEQGRAPGGRSYTKRVHRRGDGAVVAEHWLVHGSPHAWSGGSAKGSYTDARGPDASAEMVRFFNEHPRPAPH